MSILENLTTLVGGSRRRKHKSHKRRTRRVRRTRRSRRGGSSCGQLQPAPAGGSKRHTRRGGRKTKRGGNGLLSGLLTLAVLNLPKSIRGPRRSRRSKRSRRSRK